jgi:hypothetical protein
MVGSALESTVLLRDARSIVIMRPMNRGMILFAVVDPVETAVMLVVTVLLSLRL